MRTIKRGEFIPVGLSRWEDRGDSGLQLRLPIFIWHGKFYDIQCDCTRTGWKALNILIRTEYNGFNFRYGQSMVKETALPVSRWSGA